MRRRMKLDVTDVNSGSQWNAERLDGAIEVLVIERVLIVPYAAVWSCHLVAHEPDTIVAVIGFDLVYRCICPSHDGRLLSHCVTDG